MWLTENYIRLQTVCNVALSCDNVFSIELLKPTSFPPSKFQKKIVFGSTYQNVNKSSTLLYGTVGSFKDEWAVVISTKTSSRWGLYES